MELQNNPFRQNFSKLEAWNKGEKTWNGPEVSVGFPEVTPNGVNNWVGVNLVPDSQLNESFGMESLRLDSSENFAMLCQSALANGTSGIEQKIPKQEKLELESRAKPSLIEMYNGFDQRISTHRTNDLCPSSSPLNRSSNFGNPLTDPNNQTTLSFPSHGPSIFANDESQRFDRRPFDYFDPPSHIDDLIFIGVISNDLIEGGECLVCKKNQPLLDHKLCGNCSATFFQQWQNTNFNVGTFDSLNSQSSFRSLSENSENSELVMSAATNHTIIESHFMNQTTHLEVDRFYYNGNAEISEYPKVFSPLHSPRYQYLNGLVEGVSESSNSSDSYPPSTRGAASEISFEESDSEIQNGACGIITSRVDEGNKDNHLNYQTAIETEASLQQLFEMVNIITSQPRWKNEEECKNEVMMHLNALLSFKENEEMLNSELKDLSSKQDYITRDDVIIAHEEMCTRLNFALEDVQEMLRGDRNFRHISKELDGKNLIGITISMLRGSSALNMIGSLLKCFDNFFTYRMGFPESKKFYDKYLHDILMNLDDMDSLPAVVEHIGEQRLLALAGDQLGLTILLVLLCRMEEYMTSKRNCLPPSQKLTSNSGFNYIKTTDDIVSVIILNYKIRKLPHPFEFYHSFVDHAKRYHIIGNTNALTKYKLLMDLIHRVWLIAGVPLREL